MLQNINDSSELDLRLVFPAFFYGEKVKPILSIRQSINLCSESISYYTLLTKVILSIIPCLELTLGIFPARPHLWHMAAEGVMGSALAAAQRSELLLELLLTTREGLQAERSCLVRS